MFDLLIKELQKKTTLTLNIKVTPKSQKTELISSIADQNGRINLKIKVRGVPEKGLVNEELINFLAKSFHIAKSNCQIISGMTSRNKIIHIHK